MASEFKPLTNIPRPTLPTRHGNPRLSEGEGIAPRVRRVTHSLAVQAKLPPVKYQEILREGRAIIIGRLKLPTPMPDNRHAFILRRYDTGELSVSTMFKVAFPTAPEEYEKAEAAWIRANYDISGANGSTGIDGLPKLRLNGTWIKPELARHIAPAYGLEPAVAALIEAQPDPKTDYRKHPEPESKSHSVSVVTAKVKEKSHSAKRRRAVSPAVSTDTKPLTTRMSPRKKTQSPTPRTGTPCPHDSNSDETAVAHDADEEPEVPGPDMNQDIQQQQDLIADLKAKRDANNDAAPQHNRKRRNEEMATPPLSFDFERHSGITERRIVNLRRLQLQPHQKAAAWGTLAFAVGLGAVSLLPNIFF